MGSFLFLFIPFILFYNQLTTITTHTLGINTMWHNFKVQIPLKLDFLLDACMPKLPVLNKSCVVVISRNKREQRKKKDLWERELEHICCFPCFNGSKNTLDITRRGSTTLCLYSVSNRYLCINSLNIWAAPMCQTLSYMLDMKNV